MSSSVGEPIPVTLLQYRDMSSRGGREVVGAADSDAQERHDAEDEPARLRISVAELDARIAGAKAEAVAELEQKLRNEYEQKLLATRTPIAKMVESFEDKKNDYFAKVEAEVIQLSLAIARKILHREAQVDPMLVAALVRIALEKMREGSNVTIRVGAGRAPHWRGYFAGVPSLTEVEVVEDPQLSNLDCVVETDLGSANFGMDSQFKEVEQGFFDLLALRPAH